MELDIRYAPHPDDARHYTTDQLRSHFLMERVFVPDQASFTYSHVDRMIAGGVLPVSGPVSLGTTKELGTDFFLERREMGVINVGGAGTLTLDGTVYELAPKDGIYVGMGAKEIVFASKDPATPARFWVNSAPAHAAYPTVKMARETAKKVHLGDPSTLNERTIYQYVHPAVCDSCQLVMGFTVLAPGSVWNTMPCHTHERRMEVYFYFDMEPETRIFHYMGQPHETRHLVMSNEQAVISPSWSIHSGVGTSKYTFIWGMVGENQTFTDMDHVPMDALR